MYKLKSSVFMGIFLSLCLKSSVALASDQTHFLKANNAMESFPEDFYKSILFISSAGVIRAWKCTSTCNANSLILEAIKSVHYKRLVDTGNGQEAYLEGMTLNSADFLTKLFAQEGVVSLKGAYLRNAVFIGSWHNVDFSLANLTSSDLSNADFTRANFDNARLIDCNFNNAIVSHARFSHACLDGSYGGKIAMNNTNMESASLIAVFWAADMTESSLKEANVFLMQFTAGVLNPTIIDPCLNIFIPQLERPERIVFEYNPKNCSMEIDENQEDPMLVKQGDNNSFLDMNQLSDVEIMIFKVYLRYIFPKIQKSPTRRHVVHYVRNDLKANLKIKSQPLYEALESKLIN